MKNKLELGVAYGIGSDHFSQIEDRMESHHELINNTISAVLQCPYSLTWPILFLIFVKRRPGTLQLKTIC